MYLVRSTTTTLVSRIGSQDYTGTVSAKNAPVKEMAVFTSRVLNPDTVYCNADPDPGITEVNVSTRFPTYL